MALNDSHQSNIEMRFRMIFILWFAICMSVMLLLGLVQLTPVQSKAWWTTCSDCLSSNFRLSLILNGLAIVPIGISFLIKQQILGNAVASQNPDLVKTAYVVAFASCEASALLGLLDHFANGSHYYYVGFIFASLGLILNFPRKKYLLAALGQEF